jgi:hypothetical protein
MYWARRIPHATALNRSKRGLRRLIDGATCPSGRYSLQLGPTVGLVHGKGNLGQVANGRTRSMPSRTVSAVA